MADEGKFTTLPRGAGWKLKVAITEAARRLALTFAHYQQRYGELPLENLETLLRTQELDEETAQLIVTGMENLVGVLGVVVAR
jgi:hypothetical protein